MCNVFECVQTNGVLVYGMVDTIKEDPLSKVFGSPTNYPILFYFYYLKKV